MRGSAQTVLFRAGSFFGDEKQAERVIRERSGRLAAFEKTKANIREGQLAVIPSAIRSSIRHEHSVFMVFETPSSLSAIEQFLRFNEQYCFEQE